ncbi:hypothetical protein [Streptomyces sp. AC555_RSS877]|uniref:hypothetical protein n=1 Tax=Streptomyces sp. AC555_RSS877 TaxID=2823688 RepID=UPI001C256AAB|nr:hypothetical protein [Streptomyces sp. AC555_RSS877]
MDLDALRFANFSQLDTAIDDWSTMISDLETLKDDAEKGLRGASNKANWAGYNATVSKEFIGKTAGEFADAHTQATSIRNILRDTRDELKRYQGKLNDSIDRGLKKNLTVVSTGDGGFTVTMNIHPDRAAKGTSVPEHQESDVTALRDEVQRILNEATESDSSASTVLKAIADQSALGFSEANYKDRDTAAEAVKQADELAKLAKKNPEDLTLEEFDRLNAGLKKYGNDELFAERFATGLGPQKTLEFWTGVTNPHTNSDVFRNRLEQLDDMQRNLSLTLAGASQSDSAAMTDWKSNMVGLGENRIGGPSGPMGFQVMSNLMRIGDYDDTFMKQYGTELMATERKLTGNGERDNLAWHFGGAGGTMQYLNRIGEDSGADPLTGFLKGLSNSPDAATGFFNEEYISKDDPNNPFERDSDDENDYKGKVTLSNFQYLFEERDWPQEVDSHGDDLHTGQNNLALALEAATTGHPAGELPTADTPAHNGEQTKLFESIVSSISDDNGRLTDNSYMSDSIGQITSEYLPDINRAMTDDSDGDTNRLFPVAGSSATLNHRDVTALLVSVGQNPEGYAAVEVANKAYMANMMDYHMNPNLAAGDRYSNDTQFAVEQLAHGSGEISGTLAIGRQEAVAGPAKESDDAYDQSVTQWKNGISGGIGTGIGVGVTFIASPIGGAVAGGAASTVSSMVLEELFQNAEGHAKDDAGAVMGAKWESGLEENSAYTERAAELAAKAHNRTDLQDSSIDEKARAATQQGFRDAGINTEYMAPHLKTEI